MLQSYKLISFDLFQTLADLQTQKSYILHNFFRSAYNPETADRFWKDADAFIYGYFHRLSTQKESFLPVTALFEQCYATLFPEYAISLSPAEGARIITAAHNHAGLYDETEPVIAELKKTKQVCIISDTDNAMIAGLRTAVGIDKIYTSEDYRAYKFDPSGTLFKAALKDFNINASQMIHIGDGCNDVLGAAAAGIDTVWINRNNRPWPYAIKPVFEISNLRELLL